SGDPQELDFDDLLGERAYDGASAYRRSKLALIMMTFDLAAAHPHLACVVQGPVSRGVTGVLAVLDRALAGATGLYFDDQREAHALEQAYDPDARMRLRAATLAYVEPFLGANAPTRAVDAWQNAAAAGDVERVLGLSTHDITA